MKDAFPMDAIPQRLGNMGAAIQGQAAQQQAKQNTAAGVGYGQLFGIGYAVHDHMKDFALQKAVEAAVEQAMTYDGDTPEDVAVNVVKAYKAAKAELDKA